MITLNSKLLKLFLSRASDHLTGEWVLLGGTLLPAVGINVRTTVDIDLVGLGKKEASQGLELMEVAETLKLPPETVNQAAAFFLNKVGYSQEDLHILQKGRRATIYRPSLELYWKLKIGRLSETDLVDCTHYLNYCTAQNEKIDRSGMKRIIKAAMASPAISNEKIKRLKALQDLL